MSRRPAPVVLAVASTLAWLGAWLGTGCAVNKTSMTAGPNYSTTPCADNCGTDAMCQAQCTPVTGSTLPPVVITGGH
ncbi:MAG TPA: hypothetical protein VH044_10060 [Polyangiaceae bacterium]|jgi:hypothetical protein|nr:hypothetical protein [Polyangiaceae bacterium]